MKPRGPSATVIFRKELVEMLRDRRTLIAMVVVPVLLYPLLMLGSLQAAHFQVGRLRGEEIRIGVPDEKTAQWLNQQILAARELVATRPESRPAATTQAAEDDESDRKVVFLETPDAHQAVRTGAVHVAVIPSIKGHLGWRWEIESTFSLCYDSAEIRSEMARSWLERILETRRAWLRAQQLARIVPEADRPLLDPSPIAFENVATPQKIGGSLLGNVLPLILVLMTVTGAVYPAIDLTAGERERGTLETLMVAPVPVIHLIVGKFLVVAVMSLIAATLNLASIGLTLQFGDVREMLSQGQAASIPFAVLPLILLAMVPFAILFAAVLIAVASFARTFKEAQNYVMPVIMATLIPGTAAALPGVELQGVMTVIPVANMVLLVRELLLGHFSRWPVMLIAIGTTTFYAAVAVVAAARLFGQEAVLFADAGSWKSVFRRRLFERRLRPEAAHVLLYVALLFPVWFHIQGRFGGSIAASAALLALLFGALPLAVAAYLKADLRTTFSLRWPGATAWAGALLIGLSSWAVAYELLVLQSHVLPMPKGLDRANVELARQLAGWPAALLFLALAVVPGVCEELTFRGLVLGGLLSRVRPAWSIVTGAVFFAGFHFLIFRFGVTTALGVLLGYVCWRTGSILPAMLVHVMHNGGLLAMMRWPPLAERLGAARMDDMTHLPGATIAAAVVLLLAGVLLVSVAPRGVDRKQPEPMQSPALRSDTE